MIPSWRYAGFQRRLFDTDWLVVFLGKMLGNDSLGETPTKKISSLLPANSDERYLPFDQAHSEFVGRRAGYEGKHSCEKPRQIRIFVVQESAELRKNQVLLLTPKPPLLMNSANA
jgi:hypothetical protein